MKTKIVLLFNPKIFLSAGFAVFCLLFSTPVFAQLACGPVACNCCAQVGAGSTYIMYPNDPSDNKTFTFDSFGEYLSGIQQYGATTLRLAIANGPGGLCPCLNGCRWKLHVYLTNNGAVATQWEQTVVYGAAVGTIPAASLLQLRVNNACNTSLTKPGFVSISNVNNPADIRCIIDNNCPGVNPPDGGAHPNADNANPCGTQNVNNAGSYLTSPGDYTFVIDYQVTPGLTLAAGRYQLVVHYCLLDGE